MAWWNAIEPWDRLVLFLMNVGTIAGLIAENRRAARAEARAEEAHRLLGEAHVWNREEAERSRDRAVDGAKCREYCMATRQVVLRANGGVEVGPDIPPNWLTWGEMHKCFRVQATGRTFILTRHP